VHDAAATRGQYLALSKAWWSCVDNEKSCYAKLLLANAVHIQSIVDAERRELQQMLDEEDESVGAGDLLTVLSSLSSSYIRLITFDRRNL